MFSYYQHSWGSSLFIVHLAKWELPDRRVSEYVKKKFTLIVRRAILTPVRASHYLGEIPGLYRMEKVSWTLKSVIILCSLNESAMWRDILSTVHMDGWETRDLWPFLYEVAFVRISYHSNRRETKTALINVHSLQTHLTLFPTQRAQSTKTRRYHHELNLP